MAHPAAPGVLAGAVGFAVAGGHSRRMGPDKALLPWMGSTFLDHTLKRLRLVCGEVRILCGPALRYQDRDVPLDVDAVVDAGPLGGLLTGLLRLRAGSETAGAPRAALGLFVAVDVPDVPAALLRWLLELSPGHDAVIPVTAAGPEPLCAVYRSTCLEPVQRRLAAGELKMTSFWPDVHVRPVSATELGAFGDPSRLFRNVNTPAEYERSRSGG